MPVVRHDRASDASEPIVHCMRWGLVPSFTKKSERPDFYRMFNARSESVHQKTSFRRLLSTNRCLATVEGFYEWKKDGKKKQPYYVHMEDGQPFVFAALYDTWESPEGETLYTFTILTTRVSKRLEWLHDRMPVILRDEASINSWFNDDLSGDAIQKLTQPYESPDLIWYPVTPAMGRPAFNGPECVEEVKPKVAGESKIAQMFGKQLAHENVPDNKGISPDTDKGMSPDIRDADYLNDEDFKALLAGMEPDQDVSKALAHSEEGGDGATKPKSSSSIKEELREGTQEKDTEQPDQHVKLESEDIRPKGEETGASGKEYGTRNIKTSPVSTPVKPQQVKRASTGIKDHDPKRQRTHDASKENSHKSSDAGVKQKQSNLLGFFSKQ